jgi:hypothetical protein
MKEPRLPINFDEENDGKILVVHVVGTLVKADYGPFVSEFEQLLRLMENRVCCST